MRAIRETLRRHGQKVIGCFWCLRCDFKGPAGFKGREGSQSEDPDPFSVVFFLQPADVLLPCRDHGCLRGAGLIELMSDALWRL